MLYLSKQTVIQVLRNAEHGYPNEACGVVSAGLGGEVVHWLRNVAADRRNYYEVDAAQLRRVFGMMDTMGNVPVAYYHSHPEGRPEPSTTDMAAALNPGMHYLIAYRDVNLGVWRLSVWECLEMGVLVEDEYQVTP